MKPFAQWSFRLQGATLIGILGFIVLLGQAVGAFKDLEPYWFATRGYARDVVAQVKVDADAQNRQIAAGLKATTIGILDLKLVALDGQIIQLNSQIDTVNARLVETPNDGLLLGIKTKIAGDIATVAGQRRSTACEQMRAQFGPDTPC